MYQVMCTVDDVLCDLPEGSQGLVQWVLHSVVLHYHALSEVTTGGAFSDTQQQKNFPLKKQSRGIFEI
jgi:hypothetical protein